MKRKVLALVIAMAMVGTVFAGGKTDSGAQSGAQKKLVFQYFVTSYAVEWMQQIHAALQELGAQNNFEVTVADANRNIENQLQQIDAAAVQRIDGAFLFVVDEGSAPAVISKFDQAGIPVFGETLKLQDGSGNVIAPYVELDAMGVGSNAGKWVADNWKSTGVDLSNLATVGVIKNTNSRYRSDLDRVDGFVKGFKAGFPAFSDSNIFMADCAAETGSQDMTEASYKQVAAILGTNPNITAWVIFGSVDHYALGAARAVEAAGVENRTILVSSGGELAVKEWDNNTTPCWKAICYYSAMDYAKYMTEGMLAICRDGKKATDILPQFKEAGQRFPVVKVTGTMATRETYKSIMR